ncbi:TetR/AcrR family transcriptional regulator [Acinetobacter tandoii]|nr:TetR/AcrR family transcriptional regulator [Acinetobacter tandoii]
MALPPKLENVKLKFSEHIGQFNWDDLTPGRKNILNAFLRLATTEGYHAVSMRALGTAVNMKAPSIYSHFPEGKDEIVSACLRWHYYTFGKEILLAISDVKNTEIFLDELMKVHVKLQLEKPESILWDMLVAADRVSGFLQPEIRRDVQYWLDLWTQFYLEAAAELYKGNIELKTHTVMTLLDRAPEWSSWSSEPQNVKEICTNALGFAKAIFESER